MIVKLLRWQSCKAFSSMKFPGRVQSRPEKAFVIDPNDPPPQFDAFLWESNADDQIRTPSCEIDLGNATSERIQMHPDASERVRMHPNRSKQVPKRRILAW